MSEEGSMSPKAKLVLNIILVAVSAGLWAPVWLAWVVYQRWHESKVNTYQLSQSIKNTKFEIGEIQDSLLHHAALEKSLAKFDSALPVKGSLVKIPAVRLYESRIGASITSTSGTLQAQTKTGTVGIGTKLGPVGVGLAASKGETRGSINSNSITHAGKDEMTKIDQGELILSIDSIAFAGEQFSRSVNFDALLSYQVLRNEILISSKNSEKNWLVAFNSDSVATCLGQILEHLIDPTDSKIAKTKEASLLDSIRKQNLDDTALFQEELSRKKEELKELENTQQ